MADHVTLLGTKGGPAIRPGTPMPTAILVQLAGQTVLVDAGLGATRGVCDAGVPLTGIDAIIITHLHSDHYLELGPLLHTAWTAGLKQPVPIYGPSGLPAYWDGFLQSMAFDIDLRIRDEGRPALADLATFSTIDNPSITVGNVTVETMRNVHPPIEESYALRLSGRGKTVVLSGDTAPMAEMVEFARDADLLVHEAMLTAGVDALCARVGNGDDRLKTHLEQSHSPADKVAQIATEAGVKRLALNHLIPVDDPDFTKDHWLTEVTPHWSGPLFLGTDGMRIDLD